jgi:hypothetical protein
LAAQKLPLPTYGPLAEACWEPGTSDAGRMPAIGVP